MKLIQKSKQIYIFYSIIFFIVSSTVLYFTIKNIVSERQDEKLLWDKEVIGQKLKYDYPLLIFEVDDFESKVPIKDTLYFKDTLVYQIVNGIEKSEVYRQFTSIETLPNGKTYKITTRSSNVKNEDFFLVITISVGIVILLLILTIFFVNTIFLRNALRPFYENLEILKNFSVENNQPIFLQESEIDEFQELNNSLTKLTNKINSDFNNLKEFTENASHEMQTPLAIMQSKSELLMQNENLGSEQRQQIKSIYLATQRLSKLNKTLLLLSKIENQQFTEKEDILINETIDKQLEIFEYFIENKKIKLTKNYVENIKVSVNPMLFDMVISNLISNAIKHNFKKGNIDIVTSEYFISFSNSGIAHNISSSSLFERFKKDSKLPDSFGLGLAIVKKVIDTNGWKIKHSFIDNQHSFSIYF